MNDADWEFWLERLELELVGLRSRPVWVFDHAPDVSENPALVPMVPFR